jgi:pimeloyl-ACP methyl ester carboxylesterase
MGYQLQWREIAVNRNFTTRDQTRLFLNTGFGGLTPEGEAGLAAHDGLHYDVMPLLENQTLVSAEDFEVYVDKISQKGLAGGFNWYRTRRMNWEDELPLAKKGPFKFKTPYLFIASEKDTFMPPELYNNTGSYFENWTIETIAAAHWSMWEKPSEVNAVIRKWLTNL